VNLALELAYLATSEDAGERHAIRASIPQGTCIPYQGVYDQIIALTPLAPTPSRQAVWKERVRGFVEY